VTALGPGATRARERKRARRGRWLRRAFLWLLGLILLAGVFFAGIAIGRALEQAPEPGGTQTRVRTLEPLTIPPRERTVTVTTAG
jgi:hypothetical protein